jgi:hypothetical protein
MLSMWNDRQRLGLFMMIGEIKGKNKKLIKTKLKNRSASNNVDFYLHLHSKQKNKT